ncbi:MAG: phosphatidate cytidylyltransferase [Clostridia bacterium]|nr:phosphatidate cytidylyltransferase [Clostridia bacterium]
MKQRIIAAIIMIPAVVLLLLAGKTALVVAAALIALMSVYEICAAYGFNKIEKLPVLIYIMLSVPIVFTVKSGVIIDKTGLDLLSLILTVYIMLGFIIMLIFNEKVKMRDMFSSLLVSCLLVYFLSYAVKIRTEKEFGVYLIWAILVGACFTDTFALFGGKFFGKRKLAPKISPKKTVEGSASGVIGSVIMMMVYGLIVTLINKDITANYLYLALLGLVASIFAQIGDLSLSAIKREAGIKDYGNLIPGHGGVLDRLDSIIFVSPVVYYFIHYFPIFA